MFQYFFLEYKHEIYNRYQFSFKRYPLKLWIPLGAALLSAICTVVCALKNKNPLPYAIVSLVLCAIFVLIVSYYKRKTHNQALISYKQEIIEPLKALLESEIYTSYSTDGIKYLISMCNSKLSIPKTPLKLFSSFSTVIVPFITLLIGSKLDFITLDQAFKLFPRIFTIWLLACILKFLLSDVIHDIRFYDQSVMLSLKGDLQYLLQQFKANDNYVANNPKAPEL